MTTTHKLRQENPNLNKFQFTFFDSKGHHKPVACILESEKSFPEVVRNEREFRLMAIKKICQKRGWSLADFRAYGFDKFKYKRIKE